MEENNVIHPDKSTISAVRAVQRTIRCHCPSDCSCFRNLRELCEQAERDIQRQGEVSRERGEGSVGSSSSVLERQMRHEQEQHEKDSL